MKIYQITPTNDSYGDDKNFRCIPDNKADEILDKSIYSAGSDFNFIEGDWRLDKVYAQTRAIHVIGLYYLLGIVIGITTSVCTFSNTFQNPWVRDFFETEDFYLLFADKTLQNMNIEKTKKEELPIDDSKQNNNKTQPDDELTFSTPDQSEIFEKYKKNYKKHSRFITRLTITKLAKKKFSDENFLKCFQNALNTLKPEELTDDFFKEIIVHRPIIYSLLTNEKKERRIKLVMYCIHHNIEIVKFLDKELLEDLAFLKELALNIRTFNTRYNVQGWLLNRFFDLDIAMPYDVIMKFYHCDITFRLYPNKTKKYWELDDDYTPRINLNKAKYYQFSDNTLQKLSSMEYMDKYYSDDKNV